MRIPKKIVLTKRDKKARELFQRMERAKNEMIESLRPTNIAVRLKQK